MNIATASRLSLLAAVLFIAGCGQHLTGSFRISEGVGGPQDEGTLILTEVIVPLSRQQAMERFRPADLEAAGLTEADVKDGTVVFVSPYRQRQTALFPADGLYAFVKSGAGSLSSPTSCGPRGCSYGGAAVAIRVLRGSSAAGASGLYVVDSVVEPADVKGDCFYVPRDTRQSLHCKSLDSQGWQWDGDLFVKRPASAARR
jgi:hypothetical protein